MISKQTKCFVLMHWLTNVLRTSRGYSSGQAFFSFQLLFNFLNNISFDTATYTAMNMVSELAKILSKERRKKYLT